MELLDDSMLEDVNGGVNYMSMKLSKLKSNFEKACKKKDYNLIIQIAGELQARGYYSWAKETAQSYGITSF